jgi:poly(A) polymerase
LEPSPDPLRRLGALIAGETGALAERLRLSGEQRDRLAALAAAPRAVDLAGDPPAQRRALHRLGAELYRDLVLLAAADSGAGDLLPPLLALAAGWKKLALPIRGRDVTALGVPAGPEVGRLLAELEVWWEAGDFRADRRAALAELKRRLGRV